MSTVVTLSFETQMKLTYLPTMCGVEIQLPFLFPRVPRDPVQISTYDCLCVSPFMELDQFQGPLAVMRALSTKGATPIFSTSSRSPETKLDASDCR